MGRLRNAGDSGAEEPSVDMSPMIDCVFILLIFFIVTTTFVEESGIEVDKPQAASAAQLEKNSILIALTKDGEVVYGGREIGLAGVQPLVRRMLAADPATPVIVQADSAAQSGTMVRVIDECKMGGAPRVNIATKQRN